MTEMRNYTDYPGSFNTPSPQVPAQSALQTQISGAFAHNVSLPFKTGETTRWYVNREVRGLQGPTGRSAAVTQSWTLLRWQPSPAEMQLHVMKYLFRCDTQWRLRAAAAASGVEEQPGITPQARGTDTAGAKPAQMDLFTLLFEHAAILALS